MEMLKDIKASDLFVKALGNEGVEYIFGVPGEENLDLIESLRTSKIQLVVTRHEQAVGFMAATYGRLTGKAGVCLATLGPMDCDDACEVIARCNVDQAAMLERGAYCPG